MEANVKKALQGVSDFITNKCGLKLLVVGSLALEQCGLKIGRLSHDIDLEVICSPQDEKMFEALAEQSHNNYYKQPEIEEIDGQYVNTGHKPYIFKWDGVDVNVWCHANCFSHPQIVRGELGLDYATVSSVLDRKLSYNRQKDYKDLMAIISWLTNKVE